MKYFYSTILVCMLLCTYNVFGYEHLYVRDPRGWKSGVGTIEEATFTVRPKGAFSEISIYMSFSARGLGFTHKDSLEVEFYFELDKNTVFNDLWLWIGNDIMKALIMDKWTASSIYENIVKRRKDPALLVKESEGRYRLRIYPLAGDEQRKIKMTYLVPISLLKNYVNVPLPRTLLNSSKYPLGNLSIITYPDQVWINPKILETDKKLLDNIAGEYSYVDVNLKQNFQNLNLLFDLPAAERNFASTYKNESASYYQLAILPNEILEVNFAKKLVILVDYDITKSLITADQLLSSVKTLVKEYLSEKDSFNIIFSKLNPVALSKNWISADSKTVANVFDDLQNPISNYSNLATTILTAIDFIRANGNIGKIFVISNSDQFGDYQKANQLIKDLTQKMNPIIPFYIADFISQNYSSYYVSDRYYRGNEYFYMNLARITKGEFTKAEYNSQLDNLIAKTANTLNGFITNFDITTTVKEGFTYGKFTNSNAKQTISVNEPIIQIGKYSGETPLTVQISGTYNSSLFSKQIEFNNDNIHYIDSTLEQKWTGEYISLLEKEIYSNELANEIIQHSISKRVLSQYSAFLALEPNDTLKFCATCFDESSLPTKVDDKPVKYSDTLKVQAYPNPFNSQTKIIVQLPESYKSEQLTLKIYDIVGQEIRTFDPSDFTNKSTIELIWNGKNNFGESVASGIYLMVVNTPKATKSLKLLNFK